MPRQGRLGDTAQTQQDAHGCPACPHPGLGPIVAASTDVLVNDRGAARLDDIGIHAVCCGPNTFKIAQGSNTVYVNGKPFARKDDKTQHCGGSGPITEGSPDVFIDDGASAQAWAATPLARRVPFLLRQARIRRRAQVRAALRRSRPAALLHLTRGFTLRSARCAGPL